MKERPILFSADTRWVKVASARIGVNVHEYVAALNSGRKICGGCKLQLPRNYETFGKSSKIFDGLQSRCRTCVALCKKEHYCRTRLSQRETQRRYRHANREQLNAYNAEWNRKRNKKVREEMLEAYGGKCACCGESEPLFLELDHIYNDGADDRRIHRNQFQIILKLQSAGWPTDRVQLLCSNCNQGKQRNGGTCPHQQK